MKALTFKKNIEPATFIKHFTRLWKDVSLYLDSVKIRNFQTVRNRYIDGPDFCLRKSIIKK